MCEGQVRGGHGWRLKSDSRVRADMAAYDASPPSKCLLEILPVELWEHILYFTDIRGLVMCAEVSRDMHDIAQRVLHRRPDFPLFILMQVGMNEGEAKRQLAKGEINLNPVHWKVTDSSVRALAQHCLGLTRVYLGGCDNITDHSVTALAQHCLGLRVIDLNDCPNITNTAIQLLSDRGVSYG